MSCALFRAAIPKRSGISLHDSGTRTLLHPPGALREESHPHHVVRLPPVPEVVHARLLILLDDLDAAEGLIRREEIDSAHHSFPDVRGCFGKEESPRAGLVRIERIAAVVGHYRLEMVRRSDVLRRDRYSL